jgi:hypothetical protein
MGFIRDLFGKKEPATTSSGRESSQPTVAACEHEWVRVMEQDNLTLRISTKCKKCSAAMPDQKTKRINV